MEPHFLAQTVSGAPEFCAEPWYNPEGDCIVCQIADEAVVADRIDGVLTIYRSAIDDRPIGYQIKGVSTLVRNYGAAGLAVRSATATLGKGSTRQLISVSALLLAAFSEGPNTIERRQAYAAAIENPPGSHTIPNDELIPA